ncbi:probable aspartic proteinase GIP2 [Arachis stenosperma]|uniref:probable aspartic proteinase GIP2 n=1 Tax=Arachis stenosperma TaxID=217475 RepID=UPI0025AD303C|nr:probable aspartic proteinase GIP2 [Arachis stenosperma]
MATTTFAINFFILSIISLLSVPCLISASPPHSPYLLLIKKDPSTNLFYTTLAIGTPSKSFNLAIDLAGENLWYDCDKNYNSSSYSPISCNSKSCPEDAIGCISCTSGPFKPGCTNNTCGASAINQYAKFIFSAGFGEDIIVISQMKVHGLISACVEAEGFTSGFTSGSPLEGLPKSTRGILGLSRSQLALPNQLALENKIQPKFSLCLPSSNKLGYTNLMVKSIDGSVSKFVQTTPLIINPDSTGVVSVKGVPSKEYFIAVKSVKIDGNVVNIMPSQLSIDRKGNGGTKISTMSPFTELQSSVYKPFVRDFVKKALDRKMKRVASVAPFEACFDSRTIKKSVTGFVVPTIDLVLQGGVQWRIHGANSMVMAKENVACLAFVDGGTEPKMSFVKASIVIGGYQLVDNLLVFDLDSSKLSFSSSLLLHNASCSHL